MAKYKRDQSNAIGDIGSSGMEFGMIIVDENVREDTFGHRVLRVTLRSKIPTSDAAVATKAYSVMRGLRRMGWDAVLQLVGEANPVLLLLLDA